MSGPIDLDRLLRFPIPEGRQELTARDIAFYALSVGMGLGPEAAERLAYVDPAGTPVMMPSMVLVLAHPGFWLAHPDSGVDPKAVLHARQDFEITGPLPSPGLVTSRSRIAGTADRGPGKAGMVYTETLLENAAGEPFARLLRESYIRGGGGFGGSAETPAFLSPLAQPGGAPDAVVDLPTGADQAMLYRLNGDFNPLHIDPEVARAAGFPAPILHGLCTAGIVTHALLRTLAGWRAEAVRGLALRFSSVVYPGETIRTEVWRDGRFRASVPERNVIVIDRGQANIA